MLLLYMFNGPESFWPHSGIYFSLNIRHLAGPFEDKASKESPLNLTLQLQAPASAFLLLILRVCMVGGEEETVPPGL